jgi:hypothetical protein
MPTSSAAPFLCLSDSDAAIIVDNFVSLLVNKQQKSNGTLVNQILADDFSDDSDSFNWLAGFLVP